MHGRAPEDSRPRRRWRLYLAAAALGFSGLIIIVSVFLATANLGRFKAQIEYAASRYLDRGLSIDGALHIRLGRQLVIDAGDVTLAGSAPESQPALRIGRLHVVIETATLLDPTWHIPRLILEDPQVEFISREDGSNNWPPVLFEADPEEIEYVYGFLLEHVSVTGADLRIEIPAMERPLDARLERFVHEVADDRWQATTVGTINGTPVDITSNIGPRSGALLGQPLDFAIAGSLGELTFDAKGEVDDVLNPTRPVVDLDVRGPSAEYLLERLSLPVATSGPLALVVDVDAEPGRLAIAVDGVFGEFEIDAGGWVTDLEAFERFEMNGTMHGPDLQRVGRLMGVEALPAVPFDFDARAARDIDGFRFDRVGLDIGEARFVLDGRLPSLEPLEADDLRLTAEGPDIERFRELLGVEGLLSGPFRVEAILNQSGAGAPELVIDGQVGDVTEKATVRVGQHPQFHGTRVEATVAGPSARVLGDALGVDGIPAQPFSVTATAEYQGTRVAVESFAARLGEISADGSGAVRLAEPALESDWSIDVRTPDVADTLAGFGIDGLPAWDTRVRARLHQEGTGLRFEGIDAAAGPATIVGNLALQPGDGQLAYIDSDLRVRGNDLSVLHEDPRIKKALSGNVDARLSGRFEDQRLTVRQFDLELGPVSVVANGVIDHPPNLEATSLEFEGTIDSLAALNAVGAPMLPDLPFSASGRLRGEPDSLSISDAAIVAGSSVLAADLRYQPGDKPEFAVNVRGPQLDLRPFIEARQAARTPPDTESGTAVAGESNGRVIPDIPVPVAWMSKYRADIEIDIVEIFTLAARMQDLVVSAHFGDGRASLRRMHVKGVRGEAEAALEYFPVGENYRLEGDVTGKDLVVAPVGEPLDVAQARPRFDLDADFDAVGTDLRALLGTLNGRFTLDGGRGVIPDSSNWFRDLLLGDFLVQVGRLVNPVSDRDHTLRFRCVAIMLKAEDGVISGKPMLVAQTRGANLFGNGRVNLENEKLDFAFELQQRRGLGFSLSDIVNPYTHITGTLSAPRLALDEEAVLVEGGVAVATGGLSLIAKAVSKRLFQSKDPCGEALAAFDAGREQQP